MPSMLYKRVWSIYSRSGIVNLTFHLNEILFWTLLLKTLDTISNASLNYNGIMKTVIFAGTDLEQYLPKNFGLPENSPFLEKSPPNTAKVAPKPKTQSMRSAITKVRITCLTRNYCVHFFYPYFPAISPLPNRHINKYPYFIVLILKYYLFPLITLYSCYFSV